MDCGVRFEKTQKTHENVSVFFICIINKLVILQDHISQPHTQSMNKTYFGYLKADADKTNCQTCFCESSLFFTGFFCFTLKVEFLYILHHDCDAVTGN